MSRNEKHEAGAGSVLGGKSTRRLGCLLIIVLIGTMDIFSLQIWLANPLEAMGVRNFNDWLPPTTTWNDTTTTLNQSLADAAIVVDRSNHSLGDATAIIDLFDDTASPLHVANNTCHLLPGLVYVACGVDGQSFSGIMECSGHHSITHREIIVKVPTAGINKQWYHYISESQDSMDKMLAIHRKLFHDNDIVTNDIVREHFKIPRGTVSVPVDDLYTAVNASGVATKRCREVLQTWGNRTFFSNGNGNSMVRGSIMESGGQKLLSVLDRKSPAGDKHRNVAKDLVWIYRHMYQSEFIHHDISWNHIFYANNRTNLIDYSRVDLLPDNDHNRPLKKKAKQHFQQLQLIMLLANLCEGYRLDAYEVRSVTKETKGKPYATNSDVRKMVRSLENCGFGAAKGRDQRPLEDELFSSLFDRLISGNETAKAYRVLSELTGVDG